MTPEPKKVEPAPKAVVAPATMNAAPAVALKMEEAPKAEAIPAPAAEPIEKKSKADNPNIVTVKFLDNSAACIAIPNAF